MVNLPSHLGPLLELTLLNATVPSIFEADILGNRHDDMLLSCLISPAEVIVDEESTRDEIKTSTMFMSCIDKDFVGMGVVQLNELMMNFSMSCRVSIKQANPKQSLLAYIGMRRGRLGENTTGASKQQQPNGLLRFSCNAMWPLNSPITIMQLYPNKILLTFSLACALSVVIPLSPYAATMLALARQMQHEKTSERATEKPARQQKVEQIPPRGPPPNEESISQVLRQSRVGTRLHAPCKGTAHTSMRTCECNRSENADTQGEQCLDKCAAVILKEKHQVSIQIDLESGDLAPFHSYLIQS
ncbi:hypothetical protein ACLOJK_013507 [Asimina triloba]